MRRLRFALLAAAMLLAPSAAHAGPIIAAAAVWITTALPFISAAVDTFVFYAVQAGLYIGLSYGLNKLFGPKSASASAQQRQASVLQLSIGEGPREAIFGRAATGGTLLDAFNFGGTNGTDWEVLVVKVADHKCDAFEGFFIGDTFYAWSTDGAQSGFSGQLEVYWKDGSAGQAASSYLLTNSASRLYGTPWESTDVCASMAYVIFAYKADDPNATSPVWPQGRPQFKAVVRGKLCYDPRLDSTVAGGSGAHRWATPSTWAWSENAAVCDYNYDRGIYAGDAVTDPSKLLVGRGLSAEEAPPERVAARANLCDEAVTLLAGGTEPRYRVGGVIFANEPFRDVKQKFADAMGGDIVKRQGGVEVLPGAAQSVVREITDLDLVVGEEISYQPFLSDNDRVNTVIPRYVAPDQLWASVAAPIRRSTTDITADGGQKTADAALDLVTSQTQAQRIGELKRRIGRKEKRAALVLTPPHADLEDGDWIGWTSDRYFGGGRVVFRIDAYAVQQGWRNNLVLREIASSCYDWVAASDEGVPGQAPIDEFGSLDPVALAGVSITAFSIESDDSSITPAIKATWTQPADPAIRAVRLEVRKVLTTDVTVTQLDKPNDGQIITTDGVGSATDMEARLVPVSTPGRRVTASSWTAITSAAIEISGLTAAFSDGALTPGEKLYVVPLIKGLIAARTALDASAAALGVSHSAYDTASSALDTQLAALTSPVAYDDSSDITSVASPSALTTALTDAINAEAALRTAIGLAAPATSPNLVPNGGLALGTNGWTVTNWGASTAGDVGFFMECVANGTNLAESPEFPAIAAKDYTFSLFGGTALTPTAGDTYMDIEWFNSSHVALSGGSHFSSRIALPHLTSGSPYQRTVLTVTAPSGAAFARARVYTESITFAAGGFSLISQVKVEQSSSFTGFSDDGTNTAQTIVNQSPLATGNPQVVTGANRLRFTDFESGVLGWADGGNPSGLSRSKTTSTLNQVPYIDFQATATAAAQVVSIYTEGDRFLVTAGEQLALQILAGASNGAVGCNMVFFKADGTSAGTSTGFTLANNSAFGTVGHEMITVPALAVSAYVAFYLTSVAAGVMHGKVAQPYVMGVPAGQTAFPPYARGASNTAGADVTLVNTAAAFTGQGALATQSAATWSTQITGTGKPADNADVTSTHTAASISGQGSLATLSAATWSTQVTGSGKPADNADVTSTHTAAAITGQSALATASSLSGFVAASTGLSLAFPGGVATFTNTGGAGARLTVGIPSSPSWSGFISSGTTETTSSTGTPTCSGGTGTGRQTFWQIIDGDTASISTPSGSGLFAVTLSKFINIGNSFSGTLRCTVIDDAGNVGFADTAFSFSETH